MSFVVLIIASILLRNSSKEEYDTCPICGEKTIVSGAIEDYCQNCIDGGDIR